MERVERTAPRLIPVAWAVGRVTFLEVVRDKVLYNVLLAAALLFAVSFLASRLSTLDPGRVILDFGLSALNISCLAVGVLVGAGLLGREFDRRTIHVAFSHPISRLQFVLGKYLGLALLVLADWALLALVYLGLFWAQAGKPDFSFTLLSGVLLILFQTLVMAAVAVFFSSFSTTSLSVMFSLGIYLIGVNISEVRLLAVKTAFPPLRFVLNTFAVFFPNLEHFNLGSKITYDLPVSPQFVTMSVLYGAFLSFLLVIAAGAVIRGREV